MPSFPGRVEDSIKEKAFPMQHGTSFVGSNEGQHLAQLKALLSARKKISLAVAFWGEGVEAVLDQHIGTAGLRIICNLRSGGTNPGVIRRLRDRFGDVRQLDNLHAKVVLTEDAVMVGSANLSANGLGLEGSEATAWNEASIVSREQTVHADVRRWYEQMWEQARVITDSDLEAAQLAWLQRRRVRPVWPLPELLAEMPRQQLAQRGVYLAIWREGSSDRAAQAFRDVVRRVGQVDEGPQDGPETLNVKALDYWEQWPELPVDSVLISVEYGIRGGLSVHGAYVRVPQLDPVASGGWSLQVVLWQPMVLGHQFDARQKSSLTSAIRQHVKDAWAAKPADQLAVSIPLEQAIVGVT